MATTGTDAEYYICGALCSFLGLFMFVMAMFNLFHNSGMLGTFGAKFGYEMDVVMGGLMGLPNYSKIEYLMLIFAATGFFATWVHHPMAYQLVAVLGIMVAATYMVICFFYAVFAGLLKQEGGPFLVVALISVGLCAWRIARFLEPIFYQAALIGGGACIVLIVLSAVVMGYRSTLPDVKKVNRRFVEIFAWCEAPENKGFTWADGANGPEGFPEPVLADDLEAGE